MNGGRENETVRRADAAFTALRLAILDRALEPGTRLPAEAIGLGFGMSRTLAREVLLRLEGTGLVEIRPKRGAIVACPSIDEARDVFDVRRCLEARSIERLCGRWTPELERELENQVRDEEAAAKINNPGASIQLAENFHLELARMSGNRALAHYIEEVVSRCSLILALYGRPHVPDCSVSEHRMILDALKRGDQVEALRFMDEHLAALQDCATADNHPPATPPLLQVISQYLDQDDGSKAKTTGEPNMVQGRAEDGIRHDPDRSHDQVGPTEHAANSQNSPG